VRKILEKCRGTLQTQFDQWYNNLHARGMESFDTSLADEVAQATSSVPSRPPLQQAAKASTQAESKGVGGDEVDEDIMAFYQAKDELLKRRSNR